MTGDWAPHEVVEAVRRHRPHAVRYSLATLPIGPCTGEVCDSVDQWAIEIAWDLDEVIGTREIESAERRTEPDGLVVLRWWPGEDWSR